MVARFSTSSGDLARGVARESFTDHNILSYDFRNPHTTKSAEAHVVSVQCDKWRVIHPVVNSKIDRNRTRIFTPSNVVYYYYYRRRRRSRMLCTYCPRFGNGIQSVVFILIKR